MKESIVVGGCLVLAILTAGVAGVLAGSPATFLGGTPIGVALYLAVGIGLPQYVLSRERDSPLRLGLATIAIACAVVAIVAGLAIGAPADEWRFGIAPILFLVVIGNVVGAGVREFRAGYRAGN